LLCSLVLSLLALLFTSTKVQILTPEEGFALLSGTQFTCVTRTKVQILTPEELQLSRTGMPTSATSTKTGSSWQRSSKVKPDTGTKSTRTAQ
jgi:hypothetical protein